MPPSGYYPLSLITETHGTVPERTFRLACGHSLTESHMDKPRGGYLRCRFCPKVPRRPTLPAFDALGDDLWKAQVLPEGSDR